MKAVAFICLFSLSLCLSQPTSLQDAQPSLTAVKTDNKTNPTKQEGTQATIAPELKLLSGPNNTEHAADTKSPAANETKPSEGKPTMEKANANKTTEKVMPTQNESKPVEPVKKEATKETSAEGTNSSAAILKPTEAAKAGATTLTTTEKAAMVKTTEAPKDTTETPLVGKRGFDGPSFIGGIILTLGLLAIGFMGFKYYKNQTERNYHTL